MTLLSFLIRYRNIIIVSLIALSVGLFIWKFIEDQKTIERIQNENKALTEHIEAQKKIKQTKEKIRNDVQKMEVPAIDDALSRNGWMRRAEDV